MRVQALFLATTLVACQDYPFERRLPLRADAKKITEVVKAIVPTDILFVIDNSGTMQEEIGEVQANIGTFINELSNSDPDFSFQVGIITTDVECNVPDRSCTPGSETSSYSCCALTGPGGLCERANCVDDASSNCDGGRLRASSQGRRIFTRPTAAQQDAWRLEVENVLGSLGTCGSPYEAGLEAMLRAVACSAADETYCPVTDRLTDPEQEQNGRVRELNSGFIRANADLVVIFLTDEDDCSFRSRSVNARPPDPASLADQQEHLCWPNECYAHLETRGVCSTTGDCGVAPNNLTFACSGAGECLYDADGDELIDWADPFDATVPPSAGSFKCGSPATVDRLVNPPTPTATSSYLDALVAIKGDVARVRAAAIATTVPDPNAMLGFAREAACVNDPAFGLSNDCRCLSTSPGQEFFCSLTEAIGQRDGIGNNPYPLTTNGCQALPSTRYIDFLERLAEARVSAGEPIDTLADSVCTGDYDDTIRSIVYNLILSTCFDLGANPGCIENISVKLNGAEVPNVAPASATEGWSWVSGSTRVCLEGGLTRHLNDVFEIFLLENGQCP